MTSIIPNKNKKEKQRKTKLWPIVFWLMIWQAVSVFVGQEILLASPAAVLKRLFTLVTEQVFWQSLLFSGARIGAGFASWCGGGNCRSCTCRSVFHCRRTPDAAGCSSESSAGRFFCDSDPDLGFFEESFGCDFVSDGISDPVYKHAERPTGTGHSAFGDDRRFSGSAAGAAALGDPAAAVPIYPDGMFTFPRPLLGRPERQQK